MGTLLRNATLVSYCPCEVTEGVELLVENGTIARLSQSSAPSGELADHEIVDCSGFLVMPAMVVGHTHLYSSLATGMPAPRNAPSNFVEILERIWWVLDRALSDEEVYYSALVGAVRAALSGVGTLVDHHASPNAICGSLRNIREALQAVGLRGVLCYEVTDRNGGQGARAGIEENEDFLRSGRREGWYAGLVGAHASFTLNDATMGALAELADTYGVGIHIHCAEDEWDNTDALQRCGLRVVGRLASARILRPGSLLAHCTHLTAEEIRCVYDRGCWIAHNPRSNMNNSVGYAPIEEMARGRLALGTDGIDADMIAESKTAFFKARDARRTVAFDAPLRWVGGAAQLASEYLGLPLGVLREGAPADLVLVEYPRATPLSSENLAGHWFFGLSPAHIHSTMVGGRWIVRNRVLTDTSLYGKLREAEQVAKRLWTRILELA